MPVTTAGTIPARTWMIAATTGMGAFLAMLDSTLVNLALETIRADLQVPLGRAQWVVTAYLVALTVSLPAQAWLGRRFGYGRVWAWSLAVFVGASALCALAPGVGTLVVARVLQGLAAGVMVPAGQAVVSATAGDGQLGRLMGTVGLVIALGPAVGPAVGGLVLEVASWRWLFWMNLPLGVAALLLGHGRVPRGEPSTEEALDRRGLVLLGAGLPLGLYGATAMASDGSSTTTVLAVATGAALVAAFVRSSTRTRRPLVDLALLRRPVFGPAAATNLLTGMNMYAGLLLLPMWLQQSRGLGPARTGALLLAMGLGSAGTLYVAGALSDRVGPRPPVLVGAGLLAVTTLPLLSADTSVGWWLTTVLVVRGAGLALAQMPALTAAYESVPEEELGDATTLVNIAQRLGGAVGAAGIALVLTTGTTRAFTAGFMTLLLVGTATLLPGSRLAVTGPPTVGGPTGAARHGTATEPGHARRGRRHAGA